MALTATATPQVRWTTPVYYPIVVQYCSLEYAPSQAAAAELQQHQCWRTLVQVL